MITMDSPLSSPLTYPGLTPKQPAVLLTPHGLLEIHPEDAPLGTWRMAGGRTLDDALAGLSTAAAGQRHPVLALGSNASPGQLLRKFAAMSQVVPITAAQAAGILTGVSAHVSKAGYIPAAPVGRRWHSSSLHITWLDDAELAAMDETEPNYRRVRLPASYPVQMTGGRLLGECWVYESRHGYLVDGFGCPRPLQPQPELITALLRQVPGLPGLAGLSPAEWVERTRDPAVRDQIRLLFRDSGVTRRSALSS